jgi:hypothetical protein
MSIQAIPRYLWEHCEVPSCNDTGKYPEHDSTCDGTCKNCPVPVQCEFCYTNPNSVFNQQQLINAGNDEYDEGYLPL